MMISDITPAAAGGIPTKELIALQTILGAATADFTDTEATTIESYNNEGGKRLYFLDDTRVAVFGRDWADYKYYVQIFEYDFGTSTFTAGTRQEISAGGNGYDFRHMKQNPVNKSQFVVCIDSLAHVLVTIGSGINSNVTTDTETTHIGDRMGVFWSEDGSKVCLAYDDTYWEFVIVPISGTSFGTPGTPVVSAVQTYSSGFGVQCHDKPLADGLVSFLGQYNGAAPYYYFILNPNWDSDTLTIVDTESCNPGSSGNSHVFLSPDMHAAQVFGYNTVGGSYPAYDTQTWIYDPVGGALQNDTLSDVKVHMNYDIFLQFAWERHIVLGGKQLCYTSSSSPLYGAIFSMAGFPWMNGALMPNSSRQPFDVAVNESCTLAVFAALSSPDIYIESLEITQP